MSKQSDCGSPCSLKTQQITTPMIQAILTVLKTLYYVFKSTKVKSRKMQSLQKKSVKTARTCDEEAIKFHTSRHKEKPSKNNYMTRAII